MKTQIIISLILSLCISMATAETIDNAFFSKADNFFKAHVTDGRVDYASLTAGSQLNALIKTVRNADLNGADDNTIQAFYINAYNLNVINKIATNYPVSSVMDTGGFFDKDKIRVANEDMTLNQLENNKLLKVYHDARYHFVLVCGALGCPPITDFAYTPNQLDSQMEQQTKLALNDPSFIQYDGSDLRLSEIFKWYTRDFGGSSKSILQFINRYRNNAIPVNSKIKYYPYDWSCNDTATSTGVAPAQGSNSSRYIVSSTIPKGSVELKVFNNLYSQRTGNQELENRSSFFTTSLSALYGLSDRFNVGVNTRYRKVRNTPLPSTLISVFGTGGEGSSRSGITAFGPQIRYAPIPKWSNFSIQSSFVFPIGEDLTGNSEQPFIDWNGATWNTQFFNDFSIGNKFSLFTELDFLIEDIGKSSNGNINRVSTPVTAIFSYVPNTKLTLYTLGSYSPYWQENFDYFYQFGVGSKYQFTPNFEIELLYTDFTNKFLNDTGGQAETVNLGLRFNF